MGYRKLIKQYMKHVNRLSGSFWLHIDSSEDLSQRDVNELQTIWSEVKRDAEFAELGDFNQRALAIMEALALSSTEVAKILGWNEEIVSQFFLSENDPDFRKMTTRDFEHFYTSVNHSETIFALRKKSRQQGPS